MLSDEDKKLIAAIETSYKFAKEVSLKAESIMEFLQVEEQEGLGLLTTVIGLMVVAEEVKEVMTRTGQWTQNVEDHIAAARKGLYATEVKE